MPRYRLWLLIGLAAFLAVGLILWVLGVQIDAFVLAGALGLAIRAGLLLAAIWAVAIALKLYARRTSEVRRAAEAMERLADAFARDASRG